MTAAKPPGLKSSEKAASILLPQPERDGIAAQIRAAERWFAQTISEGGMALVAHPEGQAFHLVADADGVEVKPNGVAEWSWRMKPVDGGAAVPKAARERVNYGRGAGVTEWFVNGGGGIEHGYTLAAADREPVRRLRASVESALKPRLRPGRDGVDFLAEDGTPVLHYSGLAAYDADGRGLEAWMELGEGGSFQNNGTASCVLTLAVNTAGARFPVMVDPVISLAGAAIRPAPLEAEDGFGGNISMDGDFLVAAAPDRNVLGNADHGAVFVFKRDAGCAFGWTQTAAIVPPVGLADVISGFGRSVGLGGGVVAASAVREDPSLGPVDEVRLFILDAAGLATPGPVLSLGQRAQESELTLTLSADGEMLAVGVTGARYDGDALGVTTGRVFIYGRNQGGPGNWGSVTVLQPPTATADAQFGHALSLSGNTLAVAAPGMRRVFIYENTGGVWTRTEIFAPPAVPAGETVEGFGKSLSLHGDWLAIGAPDSDRAGLYGEDSGRVIVARRRASYDAAFNATVYVWFTGSLMPEANAENDFFGQHVSMAAASLAVLDSGTAGIFSRRTASTPDPAAHFTRERQVVPVTMGLTSFSSILQTDGLLLAGSSVDQKIAAERLVATNWPATHHFEDTTGPHLTGHAMARDGDLLVVSAPAVTNNDDGKVFVLRRVAGAAPGGEWVVAHTFTDPSDGFGASLALKDDVLLIGAPGVSGGTVLVYRRQNEDATSWSIPQLLVPEVTFPRGAFGRAVAFNGHFAVVGDPLANGGRGGVVVFQRPASGLWPVVMGGTAADPFRGYGAAVAITEDHHFIVGAPDTPYPANIALPNSGAAFVWRYQPVTASTTGHPWSPAWTLDQQLYPPDGGSHSNRYFGASVALSASHALCGAPGDGTTANRGGVHVFRRDEPDLPPASPAPVQQPWRYFWTMRPALNSDHEQDVVYFGQSLALNGSHAAIGAPGDAARRGQVWLFLAEPGTSPWLPVARLFDPCGGPSDGFGSSLAAPLIDEVAAGAPGKGLTIFEKQRSQWQPVRAVPPQTQVFPHILPEGYGEGPLAVGTRT